MAIFNSYVKLPEGNIIPPLAIEDTPTHVLGSMCSLTTLDHDVIGRDLSTMISLTMTLPVDHDIIIY